MTRNKQEVNEKISKAYRDLREAVWRSYKNLALLGKDNRMFLMDLGLIHSSSAKTLIDFYILQLRQKDIVTSSVSPNFLLRNWPPAFIEWSTKSVRDVFFASPQFSRLLGSEVVKETISKGVSNGIFAYVGMSEDGRYEPIYSNTGLLREDVEIAEDWFIVKEPVPGHLEPEIIVISPSQVCIKPAEESNLQQKCLILKAEKLRDVS